MNDTPMIETLTVAETTQLLRSLGMKISPGTIYLGIEQGTFPWGDCIRSKEGNPTYFVYRVLLEDWIAERTRGGKGVA